MMDFLIELLVEVAAELTAEGTVELSKSVKVPRCVRYLLIGIVVLFSAGVIGVMMLTGWLMLKESLLGGLVFLALATWMLVMGVIKFRKTYLSNN